VHTLITLLTSYKYLQVLQKFLGNTPTIDGAAAAAAGAAGGR